MKWKTIVSLLLAGAMSCSLAACGGGGDSSGAAPAGSAAQGGGSTGSVKIGAIGPLTGETAAYGEATKNAIELAVKEINDKGGVLGGRKLELTGYEDDAGDSTQGANCFDKLVSDGVSAIIGSVTSGVTAGLATKATEQEMLLLTPTATADTVTSKDTPTVFRACFRDSFQGKIAAKFAAETLKAKKVGILYASGDPYSSGLEKAFKDAAAGLGMEIVKEESSSTTSDTDFNTQLANLAAAKPDVIFAPYYYNAVGPYIVPQARAAGYKGAMIGADGWDGTVGAMKEDKSLYNNTFFTNHYAPDDPSKTVQTFVSAYKKAYGEKSLNALAALAYDSVYMLKQAIESAKSDKTADLVKAMKGMKFEGVTGKFTLDDTNTPAKSAAIIEYKDGKAVFKTTVEG